MPLVSIIVPVYKAESYLHRCIDSILSQTFQDFELILIDDGSPDNCGCICDQYAKKDSRITVIHQANQGQAAARNAGIAIASTDWVCFVDSDDAIHSHMLGEMMGALEKSNARMCICRPYEGVRVPDYFQEKIPIAFQEHIVTEDYLSTILQKGELHYYCICFEIIHISIAKAIPFTTGKVYEDSAVACQWLYMAKNILVTDAQFYFYQINPEGTTKSVFSLKRLDGQWSLSEQINFCKKQGFSRLGHILGNTYMRKAEKLYRDICNYAKDPNLAKQFRRDTLSFYRKNKKALSLTFEENRFVFETLCPTRMHFYWLWDAVKKKTSRLFVRK